MIEQFFFEGRLLFIEGAPEVRLKLHNKRLPIHACVDYRGIDLRQEEPGVVSTVLARDRTLFARTRAVLWHKHFAGPCFLKRRLHVLWAATSETVVKVMLYRVRGPGQLSPQEEYAMQVELGVYSWGTSLLEPALRAVSNQQLTVGALLMNKSVYQQYQALVRQPPARASGGYTCTSCGKGYPNDKVMAIPHLCKPCWILKNAPP